MTNDAHHEEHRPVVWLLGAFANSEVEHAVLADASSAPSPWSVRAIAILEQRPGAAGLAEALRGFDADPHARWTILVLARGGPFVRLGDLDIAPREVPRELEALADWSGSATRVSAEDLLVALARFLLRVAPDRVRVLVARDSDGTEDLDVWSADDLKPVVVRHPSFWEGLGQRDMMTRIASLWDGSRSDVVYEDVRTSNPPVRPAPPPVAASPDVKARAIDEDVQFTVYRPIRVRPEQWYPLLAFAHLAERRADAPASEPDPLTEVARRAERRLGEAAGGFRPSVVDSVSAIPRGDTITFLPEVPGVEFNPERRTFRWIEDVHEEEFRVKADRELEGRTARGRLTVFAGSLVVADVPLVFPVSGQGAPPPNVMAEPVAAAARPYRNVFPSYSRKDAPVVEQFEQLLGTLGDQYLRDVVTLRSGEVWNSRLLDLIEQADVFQLFWSSNSMRSTYVRVEWEHALRLERPQFVRPTYWEVPFPEDRGVNLPPPDLGRLHFAFLGRPATSATREIVPTDRGARGDSDRVVHVKRHREVSRLPGRPPIDPPASRSRNAPAQVFRFVTVLILAAIVAAIVVALLVQR